MSTKVFGLYDINYVFFSRFYIFIKAWKKLCPNIHLTNLNCVQFRFAATRCKGRRRVRWMYHHLPMSIVQDNLRCKCFPFISLYEYRWISSNIRHFKRCVDGVLHKSEPHFFSRFMEWCSLKMCLKLYLSLSNLGLFNIL